MARARRNGFGALVVWNPFAFRSTDPSAVYEADEPIGPDNDRHIAEILSECAAGSGLCMVGWSYYGAHSGRDKQIVEMATQAAVRLHCVGVNKDGSPRHPLYVALAAPFMPWAVPTEAAAAK